MRRVYSAENVFDACMVRDRLLAEDIDATIQGEMLVGALGELPADTRPSVWIADDAEYDSARHIVAAFEATAGTGSDWRCRGCGETNAGTFAFCWHCGKPHPAETGE